MECQNCGKQLDLDVLVCEQCGTEIAPVDHRSEEEKEAAEQTVRKMHFGRGSEVEEDQDWELRLDQLMMGEKENDEADAPPPAEVIVPPSADGSPRKKPVKTRAPKRPKASAEKPVVKTVKKPERSEEKPVSKPAPKAIPLPEPKLETEAEPMAEAEVKAPSPDLPQAPVEKPAAPDLKELAKTVMQPSDMQVGRPREEGQADLKAAAHPLGESDVTDVAAFGKPPVKDSPVEKAALSEAPLAAAPLLAAPPVSAPPVAAPPVAAITEKKISPTVPDLPAVEEVKLGKEALGHSPLDGESAESGEELKRVLQTIFKPAVEKDKPAPIGGKAPGDKIKVKSQHIDTKRPAKETSLQKPSASVSEPEIPRDLPMSDKKEEPEWALGGQAAKQKAVDPPILESTFEEPMRVPGLEENQWSMGDQAAEADLQDDDDGVDIEMEFDTAPPEKPVSITESGVYKTISSEPVREDEGIPSQDIPLLVDKFPKSRPIAEVEAAGLKASGKAEIRYKEEVREMHVIVAGVARRFLAGIIDSAIVLVLTGLFISLGMAIFGVDRLPDTGAGSLSYLIFLPLHHPPMMTAYLLLAAVFWICMTVSFTITTGQTPGEILLDLKIIQTDGERVVFPRSLVRVAGHVLAALPFFLGLLWMIVDSRKQGLHDKLAQTLVIRAGLKNGK